MAQSPSKSINHDPNCAFCKIGDEIPVGDPKSDGIDQSAAKTESFYSDEQLLVIADNKPRTPHHYLVITREHIESAKTLSKKHVDLVRRMVEVGAQVLKDRYKDGQVDIQNIMLGYHWPPMTIIKHLHLHVMYPASELSFFARNVIFNTGLLFITPDDLIERIRAIPDQ